MMEYLRFVLGLLAITSSLIQFNSAAPTFHSARAMTVPSYVLNYGLFLVLEAGLLTNAD